MNNRINDLENQLDNILETIHRMKLWCISKEETEAYRDHWNNISDLQKKAFELEGEILSLKK